MIKREESRHDFAFMAGVVIGAVAGAFATLAMAPRAGTETRERWRARMDQVPVDNVRERATHLRQAAATKTGELREAASSTSPGELVQSTRSRATDLVNRSPVPVTLGEGQEDLETQVAEAASEAKDTAEETVSSAAEQADQVIEETTSGTDDSSESADEDDTKTNG